MSGNLLACLVDDLLEEVWELLHYGDRLAGGQGHPVHWGCRVVCRPGGGMVGDYDEIIRVLCADFDYCFEQDVTSHQAWFYPL